MIFVESKITRGQHTDTWLWFKSAKVQTVEPFQAHRGELLFGGLYFFCLFFGQTANSPPVGNEETPRIGETRYDGLAKKTNQALAFTGYRLCKNR